MEHTTPIPGMENYGISEQGGVYALLTDWRGYGIRRMTQHIDQDGYPYVRLTTSGKRRPFKVHRLMLLTFRGQPPESTLETRHLDGNPQNNMISNLVWGTRKKNACDRTRDGRHHCNRGERNGNAKLNTEYVLAIRKLADNGISQRKIARQFGIDQSTVSYAVSGKGWHSVM